jgi:SAM-dependent methyltransferase
VASAYLHGYRSEERDRLHRQAEVLAGKVHEGLPFASSRRLVELGCGVGAQSEILLRSFPALRLVGVDVSPGQVEAAARRLSDGYPGRAEFVCADARHTGLGMRAFDGAFVCWMLEHVSEPLAVLAEARRLLEDGAPIACCEVLNATLFVEPHCPALLAYWAAYNEHQAAIGGDPHVGAKLGNLLLAAGFREVRTEARTYHLDARAPEARRDMLAYFADLLLSAAPGLVESGRVTAAGIDGAMAELGGVARAPDGVFFYSFVRAVARA